MYNSLANSNWQNNYISKKHIVSLLFAVLTLVLLLLIPIQIKQIINHHQKTLNIELVKVTTPKITKAENFENIANKPPRKPTKQDKVIQTVKAVKQKQPKKTINIIHKKPIEKSIKKSQEKIKIVRKPVKSVTIINSLQQKPWLNKLDKDFQVKSDKDLDYIAKQYIKPKAKKLVIDSNAKMQIKVKDTIPVTTQIAKMIASKLSFMPIDDIEKTVDDVPYCPTLLQHSITCPSASPLHD